MAVSVPGNSCRPCGSLPSNTNGCVIRLSGECVYYSGASIPSADINMGDNFNTVVTKLANSLVFNNGLTNTAGVVQLGGTLIQFTDINNSGNDFFLHGTGNNILRTVNGTAQYTVTSSPIAASLLANNSSTNLFSEVNAVDNQAVMTSGNSTTFYNTLLVTPTYIRLEVNTNTTPHHLQLNTTGQLVASRYGQGLFTGTPAYNLQVDSSGNVIEGSATGGGGIIPIISTDFDPDGVTVTDSSLNGKTYEIFLNDLNRFIYNEVGNQEWDYVVGGGFVIMIPGFDATTNDYHLYVFLK